MNNLLLKIQWLLKQKNKPCYRACYGCRYYFLCHKLKDRKKKQKIKVDNKKTLKRVDIAFLCNGKRCERCSPECMHTTDIAFAKNFKSEGKHTDITGVKLGTPRVEHHYYFEIENTKEQAAEI